MFNWANSQLEKLSETLAPPPSTPAPRFLAALASHDENAALAILNDPQQPLDPNAPLKPRGVCAIHVAASHGAVTVLRELILRRGIRVDIADYQGWSALHHAASSTSISHQASFAVVKMLVEECGASVVAKNAMGQAPYDVASSQAVRGYLLPRQLQRETQEEQANIVPIAPPPMVHGNVNTTNSHHGMQQGIAPPPSMTIANNNNMQQVVPANDVMASLQRPPNSAPPKSAPLPPPPHMQSIQPPPNSMINQQHQQQHHQQPMPPTTRVEPPKSTGNTSAGYALRGGNSNNAAMKDARYKPDGFHSSSNDKELQAKYGHVENSFTNSAAMAGPPPPTSGGLGGVNPYSGMGGNSSTSAASGYTSARSVGATRYPVYCAVSDSVSSVSSPPTSGGFGGGMGMMQQQPVQVPSYATFTPGMTTAASNNGNTVQQMPVAATHQSSGIQHMPPPPHQSPAFTTGANVNAANNGSALQQMPPAPYQSPLKMPLPPHQSPGFAQMPSPPNQSPGFAQMPPSPHQSPGFAQMPPPPHQSPGFAQMPPPPNQSPGFAQMPPHQSPQKMPLSPHQSINPAANHVMNPGGVPTHENVPMQNTGNVNMAHDNPTENGGEMQSINF